MCELQFRLGKIPFGTACDNEAARLVLMHHCGDWFGPLCANQSEQPSVISERLFCIGFNQVCELRGLAYLKRGGCETFLSRRAPEPLPSCAAPQRRGPPPTALSRHWPTLGRVQRAR